MSIALSYTDISKSTEALEALINECIQNDRQAQNRLYRMFYPRLMPMTLRYLSDNSLAEEVLQDSFLKVFRYLHTYKFTGSFEGWIKTIVRRTIIDYAKVRMHHNQHVILEESDISIDFSVPSDRLLYNDLLKLIKELPDSTRIVFNMHIIDGMPHREIAKEVGISESTSKWHIYKARGILQQKIKDLNLL